VVVNFLPPVALKLDNRVGRRNGHLRLADREQLVSGRRPERLRSRRSPATGSLQRPETPTGQLAAAMANLGQDASDSFSSLFLLFQSSPGTAWSAGLIL
jgi:hypothetical protein